MSNNNYYNHVKYKWQFFPYFYVEETSENRVSIYVEELHKTWWETRTFVANIKLEKAFDWTYHLTDVDNEIDIALWEYQRSIDKNKNYFEKYNKEQFNDILIKRLKEKFSYNIDSDNTYEDQSTEALDLDINEWTEEVLSNKDEIKTNDNTVKFKDIDDSSLIWEFDSIIKNMHNWIFKDRNNTMDIVKHLNSDYPVFSPIFTIWKIKFIDSWTWSTTKEMNIDYYLESYWDKWILRHNSLISSFFVSSRTSIDEDIQINYEEKFKLDWDVDKIYKNISLTTDKILSKIDFNKIKKQIKDKWSKVWYDKVMIYLDVEWVNNDVQRMISYKENEIQEERNKNKDFELKQYEELNEIKERNKWFFWKITSFFK